MTTISSEEGARNRLLDLFFDVEEFGLRPMGFPSVSLVHTTKGPDTWTYQVGEKFYRVSADGTIIEVSNPAAA